MKSTEKCPSRTILGVMLPCVKEKCAKYVTLFTPHKAGEEPKQVGRCADHWAPLLMVENTAAITNQTKALSKES